MCNLSWQQCTIHSHGLTKSGADMRRGQCDAPPSAGSPLLLQVLIATARDNLQRDSPDFVQLTEIEHGLTKHNRVDLCSQRLDLLACATGPPSTYAPLERHTVIGQKDDLQCAP